MSASSRPFLSVVVLCYRAGDSARTRVRELEEALRTGGIEDFQLVLVGNYIEGSDDPTPAVVRDLAAADPRVVCTAVAKRGWMGWDLRTGLALATGEVIGFLDGDGQNLAGDLPRLHRMLLRDGLDLVKTVRRRRVDDRRCGQGLRERREQSHDPDAYQFGRRRQLGCQDSPVHILLTVCPTPPVED